jgi:hypothetical protein
MELFGQQPIRDVVDKSGVAGNGKSERSRDAISPTVLGCTAAGKKAHRFLSTLKSGLPVECRPKNG